MGADDTTFYLRRALQEQEAARTAACPEARVRHRQLAAAYWSGLADGRGSSELRVAVTPRSRDMVFAATEAKTAAISGATSKAASPFGTVLEVRNFTDRSLS